MRGCFRRQGRHRKRAWRAPPSSARMQRCATTRQRRLLVTSLSVVLAGFQLLLGFSACSSPLEKPADIAGWTLTWSDEFNEPDGSGVNPRKWTVETGGW